ncbi:MAG TPA: hypothetical protein VG937_29870 [Polyangiaceae bacterium]|nr:hypothetical protein [Polyangiaceae bacterium]
MTSLSGVGRTTFYECFDDFGHALSAVRGDVAQRVRRALSLRSEHPDLAELCSVWLRVASDEPLGMLAALEPQSGAEPEVLTLFRDAISRWFPVAQTQGATLMHAVACAQASARSMAIAALGAPSQFSGAMGAGGADAGAPGELAIESLTRSIRCLLADKL